MDALGQLRLLYRHNAWADELIRNALAGGTHPEAAREYAHIVAVEAIWLDRLLQQPRRTEVWPARQPNEMEAMRQDVIAELERFLGTLNEAMLDQDVSYKSTEGVAYVSKIGEILLHVALHGQYHRGKVNLLLRQGGAEPAPTDLISFTRGAPAARTKLA